MNAVAVSDTKGKKKGKGRPTAIFDPADATENGHAGNGKPGVGTVAVIAHQKKVLGGGLDELRSVLAHAGVDAPLWYEVPKSKKAPKLARKAIDEGADLLFVWGGDGMVQRCIDAVAGSGVTV